jgi:Ni/Fe-hydrogenase subunit HybB-like protein
MIEKALSGSKTYYAWVALLLLFVGIGFATAVYQYFNGLGVTGMSRDVPWGFYIAQFTFLVGVAASAVMVVIPYYLHNYKKFGKMAVLGEFVAIAAVIMCMSFIVVDMGQTARVLNIFLHPSPTSLMFWDTIVCFGYLILNIVITWVTFGAEKKGIAPPKWIKPVIYLSVPWAVSIHTVTAFLYAGLAARPFWMSAILAPRFLASAFAAGPALLILLAFLLRRFANYDVGKEAIQKLAQIVTYAMVANVFFIALEIFTAVYSNIPEHLHHFQYMFFGLTGADGVVYNKLVPFMWISTILAFVSLGLLLIPSFRNNEGTLKIACVTVFFSLWIDKGLGMVVTGFIPNPNGVITEYAPSWVELLIALGVWSLGFLVITVMYKVTVTVRKEAAGLA